MIAVTYNVERYRSLLADTVRAGDVVLEIGPHRCKSTEEYVAKAGKAILVDKGHDCSSKLEEYADERENVTFVFGDVRGFDAVKLVLHHISECDVMAVDLGGGRFPDTVFKVWATWSGIFKPRDSIIRCRGLAEFLKRAEIRDESLPGKFRDSGWLEDYGRKTPYNLKKQLDEIGHWVDINQPLD
ncbi:MAG: SAM-dependent methyltransferase [Candidatus Altiarchaeales archaeon]|nr:SAM-dependent methyltransferase [Candidatus Altiarchaeales archaeon]MBD3416851.1 SAM-dependent methyltransferase [Candidatus Altiarchaeales archaeon]